LYGGLIGIHVRNATNVRISGNTVTKTFQTGITLDTTRDSTIFANELINSGARGIFLLDSDHGTITNNLVSKNTWGGIVLWNSGNSTVTKNTAVETNDGISLSRARSTTVADNILTDNYGEGVFLEDSEDTTVLGNSVIRNFFGISLSYSRNTTIMNNTVTMTQKDGIFLYDSYNNTISRNVVTGGGESGISLEDSVNNTISRNTVSNNRRSGVHLDSSGSNKISNNILLKNGFLVVGSHLRDYLQIEVDNNLGNRKPIIYWQHLTGGAIPNSVDQIILVNCTAVTVSNRTFSNTAVGVLAAYSADLSIHDNYFYDNSWYGVSLVKVEGSIVAWNEFIGNNPRGTSQAYDDGINNTFTNNYWNEWSNPDLNQDGIVDEPYQIDGGANSQDTSPLALPEENVGYRIPEYAIYTLVLLAAILAALGISIGRQRQT
jgi:parallel beta-helix repeat protein